MMFLYILLIIIALILVIPLFVSKDLNYEKSVTIDAPASHVWKHVSSHEGMDRWSPWSLKDPNMESTLTGEDGTVGACKHWKSGMKGVGEGKQTLTKLEAPNLAETRIEFIKPFKSIADGYMKLQEHGSQTTATWGFKSQMPYPMNIMKLFMNFEKSMDKDFGEGLAGLKKLSEV